MSTSPSPIAMRVHATAVAFADRCVLLRGKSGSGKSDLALRLLALRRDGLAAFGVADLGSIGLVADDQVQLTRVGRQVVATAPKALAGLLEVRGIGIVPVERRVGQAVAALVVDLVAADAVPRLPEAGLRADLLGVDLPCLALDPFAASAALKVAFALHVGFGIAAAPQK